ncbi:hypothetical protein [Phenylobacterium immobile]|uniref:hypothetical protein n=1 Tax=Phenylobacterium immobile TaxID=21 RepID=UPI000AE0219D|nr:hypothetical protein [Phenylobacterium immobile]
MRTLPLICVSLAAATALSACASSGGYGYRGDRYAGGRYETRCERDRSNNRAVGTVAGVAGAVIGNQIAKGDPCPADYYR